MYRKILVPFDNSEPSQHALQAALDMTADAADAQITVLAVVDGNDAIYETFKIASRMSGVLGDALDVNAVPEPEDERAKDIARIQADIAPLVGDAQNVVIDVVKGSPHDAITAYAAGEEADCIVMGHRGMGSVRGMLGSVCYSVLHKTNVPVLVVK
ncbi:universal stress protein [Eggerthellaceae bacterium 3-80]